MINYQNTIQEYFKLKEEIQVLLLNFIECTNPAYYIVDLKYFHDDFKNVNKQNQREELEHFLRLLLNIANNYHRTAGFFNRIEQILQLFENEIKQTFSNFELFELFYSSKPILLFLFKNHIIVPTESIINELLDEGKNKKIRYCHFFLPEIKEMAEIVGKDRISKIEKEIINIESSSLENYEQKRLVGENETVICNLIRNDSIVDFISFINKESIQLSSSIKPSIFETNLFLIDKKPSLIEYAAFFGSINIFNYLYMNNVELSPILINYAIHGKNAEIISFIENNVQLNKEKYEECFEESIKCHHNDFADYFLQMHLLNLSEKNISDCFEYFNYSLFSKFIYQDFLFFYFSKYGYSQIVEIFFKMKRNDIKSSKIFNRCYFFIKFKNKIFNYISNQINK